MGFREAVTQGDATFLTQQPTQMPAAPKLGKQSSKIIPQPGNASGTNKSSMLYRPQVTMEDDAMDIANMFHPQGSGLSGADAQMIEE